MHFKALFLAAVLPLVSAGTYPITADDVKCRSSAGTSHEVVRTYSKGTEVTVSCQKYGESIFGNNIWDMTGSDCYVSDYYVKTGSDGMVEPECDGGGGDDESDYNGPITRKEVMSRGQFWVDQNIPYSMDKTEPDQNGRKYRTDCSGFVSMAYHATSPGYSTVSLPSIAHAIEWSELKEGDMVGTLGDGTANEDGHVVIFKSWIGDDKKEFNTIECKGTDGCVAWEREVSFPVGSFKAKPYRYTRIKEE